MPTEHDTTRPRRGSTTRSKRKPPRWPTWFLFAIGLAALLLLAALVAAVTGAFGLAAALTGTAGQTGMLSAVLLEQERRDRG